MTDESALGAHLAERLRGLRTQRGWSLEKLSSICGVSRSMLSQIERREANPTVAVALAIARALGVTLDELVTPPDERDLKIIRSDDTQYLYRSDESCRIRTLSPLSAERELEFYEIALEPGGELRSAPHFRGTREFLTVRKGRVRVESGHDHTDLQVGDSIAYPADVAHAIVNAHSGRSIVYLIDTCP